MSQKPIYPLKSFLYGEIERDRDRSAQDPYNNHPHRDDYKLQLENEKLKDVLRQAKDKLTQQQQLLQSLAEMPSIIVQVVDLDLKKKKITIVHGGLPMEINFPLSTIIDDANNKIKVGSWVCINSQS